MCLPSTRSRTVRILSWFLARRSVRSLRSCARAKAAWYRGGVSLGDHGEGQAWLRRPQIVLELGQDAALGMLRIQGDEPAGTAHPREADGTAPAVKGPAALVFVQMTD